MNRSVHASPYALGITDGAAAPAYVANGQSNRLTAAITDTGAGDISPNLGANVGLAAADVALFSGVQAAMAAGAGQACGCTSTNNTAKRITIAEEANVALVDVAVGIVALAEGIVAGDIYLAAAGAVAFAAGVPSFTWQSGAFTNAIVDTGLGDIRLDTVAGYNFDQDVWLFSPRGVLAASGIPFFGINQPAANQNRVTIVQEAAMGGASVAADVDFDFAVFSRHRVPCAAKIHAIGRLTADGAGGTTAWAMATGYIDADNFTNNAAGDIHVNLEANFGVAANRSCVIGCADAALVAGQDTIIGCNHISATEKQLTILNDAQGPSALVDRNLNFLYIAASGF